MLKSDKPATLIRNCSVLGRSKINVRNFQVCDPAPYAQYATTVAILFTEPRKRNRKYAKVFPDNLTFWQIEQNGEIVYDSRNDVPLNPEAFMESYKENKARWLLDMEDDLEWGQGSWNHASHADDQFFRRYCALVR